MFTLYTLAQQQLSKQFHYDFGLRGIVTLTRYAGRKKRLYPNLPDDEVRWEKERYRRGWIDLDLRSIV